MYQGVLRDDERQRARRLQMEREVEFEEQKRRRAVLEAAQPVTNPSGPVPEQPSETSKEVSFEGCKSC